MHVCVLNNVVKHRKRHVAWKGKLIVSEHTGTSLRKFDTSTSLRKYKKKENNVTTR